jgi:hypothetical protein
MVVIHQLTSLTPNHRLARVLRTAAERTQVVQGARQAQLEGQAIFHRSLLGSLFSKILARDSSLQGKDKGH